MLRTLTACFSVVCTACFADDLPNATTHGALIDQRLEQAATLGADLEDRLQILQREFDLPTDLMARARESLENGRVREMLNIGPGDLPQTTVEEQRYPGGLYVFASFSMPDLSLRALLSDASDLGIPVVFNGFVDNSVIATEARVRKVYDGTDISHGFIIDPTLFTRFEVTAVPTLVSTMVNLDVCDTQGCGGDAVPDHDRAAGNVPLSYLLTVIAKGDTPHATPARVLSEALE